MSLRDTEVVMKRGMTETTGWAQRDEDVWGIGSFAGRLDLHLDLPESSWSKGMVRKMMRGGEHEGEGASVKPVQRCELEGLP